MPGGLHYAWSSASLWIRQVDGAGAVARKAIDRIGGERAQISHAANHSGSCSRNGVTVKAITMPAAPCIVGVAGVVVVGIVTHIDVRGALGGRRPAARSSAWSGCRSARGRRDAWRGRRLTYGGALVAQPSEPPTVAAEW